MLLDTLFSKILSGRIRKFFSKIWTGVSKRGYFHFRRKTTRIRKEKDAIEFTRIETDIQFGAPQLGSPDFLEEKKRRQRKKRRQKKK